MTKKPKIKKRRKNRRKKLAVYLVLRILVIISMVIQMLQGNWLNVFLCVATLLLFTLPGVIQDKLKVEFPTTLEVIVYFFIFSHTILGEIANFYGTFPYWDTMLHTFSGFLCAAVGFSLVDVLNQDETFQIAMTPIFVSIVAFCFSMTVGVLWEFLEYSADHILLQDMQKDRIVSTISSVKINPEGLNEPIIIKDINKTEIYSNSNKKITTVQHGYLDLGIIDTMKDLFVNFIGAVIFSIIGYFYLKNRDRSSIAKEFIPKMKRKINDSIEKAQELA